MRTGDPVKIIPALLAGLALLSCNSLQPFMAGSVTEGGNVTGRIVDSTGYGAEGVRVQIIPSLYDPIKGGVLPDSLTDTTGESGVYSFSRIGPGYYNLVAVHLDKRIRAKINLVRVGTGTVRAADCLLRDPGAVKVMVPDSADTVNGYLYVPGTSIFAVIRHRGILNIDSVPAGTVTAVYYAKLGSQDKPASIAENIAVPAGGTAIVAYPAWSHSKSLYLNTTASGAGVVGTVTGFPVLIRLTDANFDFTQAKAGGADIRFAKSDGTPLPFEIGRWDAARQRAEIWVKADTVYGNDSSHAIMMYWGASTPFDSAQGGSPATPSLSNGAAVFDASTGSLCVWHLDEAATTVPGGYRDATANGYHLTGAGTTPAVAGVIGDARAFDTTADCLEGSVPPSLAGNASFTVMLWVRTGAMASENIFANRVDIMDFGSKEVTLVKSVFHVLLWPDYTMVSGFGDTASIGIAQNIFSFSPYAGVWSLVATEYDAAAGVLSTFINGVQVDRDTTSGITLITSGGLRIGKSFFGFDRDFAGAIDEVRIYGAPVSGDWIKLCYMNQRSDERLVVFGREGVR